MERNKMIDNLQREDILQAEIDALVNYNLKLKAENESLQEQLKDAVNDYESLLNHDSVK